MRVALLLSLVLFAVPLSAQHGEQPTRTYPPLTPALIRADLVVVREQFIMRDAAFTAVTRAAALERLTRLERAADTVQRAFRELQGGITAWRDRAAPYLFESPALLAALGLSAGPGAATYTFILAGYAPTSRWLSPSPTQLDGREWSRC